MRKDYLAISKNIDDNLYYLAGQVDKLESEFGWIRDMVLEGWLIKNGMYGFYKDNETLGNSFISDRLASIFFESGSEQEANDRLNLLTFELLEAGFEL